MKFVRCVLVLNYLALVTSYLDPHISLFTTRRIKKDAIYFWWKNKGLFEANSEEWEGFLALPQIMFSPCSGAEVLEWGPGEANTVRQHTSPGLFCCFLSPFPVERKLAMSPWEHHYLGPLPKASKGSFHWHRIRKGRNKSDTMRFICCFPYYCPELTWWMEQFAESILETSAQK